MSELLGWELRKRWSRHSRFDCTKICVYVRETRTKKLEHIIQEGQRKVGNVTGVVGLFAEFETQGKGKCKQSDWTMRSQARRLVEKLSREGAVLRDLMQ